MRSLIQPDHIAPLVGYPTSADNDDVSGCLFELSGGWIAQSRWQRSGGYGFPTVKPYTPEDVVEK
ncbi:hypothetical protein F5879DRAFT_1060229 [Lentinula edodes]|nr:hypothetical protein F5879DRAFT_1060229 [Lentinula edodes]